MAGPAADTRLERPDPPVPAPAGPDRYPPVALTVALAVVLAVGAFALLMPLVLIVDQPTPLPSPFAPQNQDAETLTFVLAFAAVLPLSLVAARRLGQVRSPVVGFAAATLGALIAGVKLVGATGGPDGVWTVLAAAIAWWLIAAALYARPPSGTVRVAAALATAGAGVAILALTDLGSVSPLGLVAAGLLAAGAYTAYERVQMPRLSGPWALALEAGIVIGLLLAVPDLVVFRPENAPGNLDISVETSIIRFHQDLILGPASQMLGGAPMLVDTGSQYGVGDIYAVVGWFLVAPIGYGTFALWDAIMTALWFLGGYAVLRFAGAPRSVAAGTFGVAVVALAFNLTYPVGALPQYGPLRFGVPMALIVFEVAAERWPTHRRAAHRAALVVLGLSALWSLEALAYTAIVYLAITAMRAWLRPRPGRLNWLGGQAGQMVLAWACAHLLFALATLAGTGQLPSWGMYLDYLREFLFGPLGDLTYDVPRWSPGLIVGTAYLASTTALIELARRRHPLVDRQRTAVITLTALTAYGIALLSYWVDRSLEHILVHVALPALLITALWVVVLVRAGVAHCSAPALALALCALVVASAWSSIGDRFPRSALAHAAPGGASLRGAVARLWHPPALNRSVIAGQRTLERHMPREHRSVVLTGPDNSIEILLRSGRVDRLLLSDAWETSFVAKTRLGELRRRVDALRAGDRILMDQPAVNTLRYLQAHPSADPLTSTVRGLAPLQRWALARIAKRFRLHPVTREQGYTVMELRS